MINYNLYNSLLHLLIIQMVNTTKTHSLNFRNKQLSSIFILISLFPLSLTHHCLISITKKILEKYLKNPWQPRNLLVFKKAPSEGKYFVLNCFFIYEIVVTGI